MNGQLRHALGVARTPLLKVFGVIVFVASMAACARNPRAGTATSSGERSTSEGASTESKSLPPNTESTKALLSEWLRKNSAHPIPTRDLISGKYSASRLAIDYYSEADEDSVALKVWSDLPVHPGARPKIVQSARVGRYRKAAFGISGDSYHDIVLPFQLSVAEQAFRPAKHLVLGVLSSESCGQHRIEASIQVMSKANKLFEENLSKSFKLFATRFERSLPTSGETVYTRIFESFTADELQTEDAATIGFITQENAEQLTVHFARDWGLMDTWKSDCSGTIWADDSSLEKLLALNSIVLFSVTFRKTR